MGRRLWFIGDGEKPIDVFPSHRSALYELEAIEREEGEAPVEYEIYWLEIDDLEDHPTELALAEREGLV